MAAPPADDADGSDERRPLSRGCVPSDGLEERARTRVCVVSIDQPPRGRAYIAAGAPSTLLPRVRIRCAPPLPPLPPLLVGAIGVSTVPLVVSFWWMFGAHVYPGFVPRGSFPIIVFSSALVPMAALARVRLRALGAARRGEPFSGMCLPFDVSFPWPPTLASGAAVSYSLSPASEMLARLLLFLRYRGAVPLVVSALWAAIVLLSEGGAKKALRQPRPAGSFVPARKPGMPSTHAMLSMAQLAYFLSRIYAWRWAPARSRAAPAALDACAPGSVFHPAVGCAYHLAFADNLDEPSTAVARDGSSWPVHGASQPDALLRLTWAALNTSMFAPVPLARVLLRDHTRAQVAVGAALGVLLGCAWAELAQCVFYPYLQSLCDWEVHDCFVQRRQPCDSHDLLRHAAREQAAGGASPLPAACARVPPWPRS